MAQNKNFLGQKRDLWRQVRAFVNAQLKAYDVIARLVMELVLTAGKAPPSEICAGGRGSVGKGALYRFFAVIHFTSSSPTLGDVDLKTPPCTGSSHNEKGVGEGEGGRKHRSLTECCGVPMARVETFSVSI